LASVLLIALFLVLLVAIEWVSRRLTSNKRVGVKGQEAMKEEAALTLALSQRGRGQMPETVQQQMLRTTTAEGWDRLEGTFWAEFPTDAMTTTVHIPFCPAFKRVPTVQVLPSEETDANLRIISPKMFGVRVDVKRNAVDVNRFCFTIVAEG